MKRRQKAFTLVELMVACTIIGIISGIATIQCRDAIVKSKIAAALVSVKAKGSEQLPTKKGFNSKKEEGPFWTLYLLAGGRTSIVVQLDDRVKLSADFTVAGGKFSNIMLVGYAQPYTKGWTTTTLMLSGSPSPEKILETYKRFRKLLRGEGPFAPIIELSALPS